MEVARRQPCNRLCDCEWGSKVCFLKRGYIWNYPLHKWCRDENGVALRTLDKDCEWEPRETIEQMTQLRITDFL